MGSDDIGQVTKNRLAFEEFLREGMAYGYPNADRHGCPSAVFVKQIADRKVPIEDLVPWMNHLQACSPCFRDYQAFVGARRRRLYGYASVAAGIIVVISAASWLSVRNHFSNESFHASNTPAISTTVTAKADVPLNIALHFENVSVSRGDVQGSASNQARQQLPRHTLALSVYLPLGSEAGRYEVQLLKNKADVKPLGMYTGAAEIENGFTILSLTPDLSQFAAGPYVLRLRHAAGTWRYFRIILG